MPAGRAGQGRGRRGRPPASWAERMGGPTPIVPDDGRPVGRAVAVAVAVRADDIVLARGPIPGLSARNRIAGTVERIVPHGTEAEVLVRTGSLTWIVSVVAPAVADLELHPGAAVHMIIKARSCQILGEDPTPGSGPLPGERGRW